MNRNEDNTCEYCKADLPREAVGTVHFCSFECFEANEREASEQARARNVDPYEERMHEYALMFPAPYGLLGRK